jgi:endonuclease YncB( thermonuclease family)
MPLILLVLLVGVLMLIQTLASPIELGAIEVVDGDTIRAGGRTYRLVGFDTAETGSRARCESERALAAAASRRLSQLVAGGGLDLEQVACACKPGTEGTRACNHGRSCGVLKVRGRDVGALLIEEGLARPFVCGTTSCPPQQGWCSLETTERAPDDQALAQTSPLSLACKGIFSNRSVDMGVVVDLDARLVHGFWQGNPIPITSITAAMISFRGQAGDQEINGNIDRITGKSGGLIGYPSPDGRSWKPTITWDLVCKPSRPVVPFGGG